jgi:hypothetical protein
MQLNKYFSIIKCTSRTAWKIRLSVLGLIAFLYVMIVHSLFKLFFQYLGYEKTNGCPFYTITGLPCPTCGMGRGLSAIIHVKSPYIFYYNPSSVFVYIVIAVILLAVLILSFFNYKIKPERRLYMLWPLFVAVVLIIWLLNIFFGHHSY